MWEDLQEILMTIWEMSKTIPQKFYKFLKEIFGKDVWKFKGIL